MLLANPQKNPVWTAVHPARQPGGGAGIGIPQLATIMAAVAMKFSGIGHFAAHSRLKAAHKHPFRRILSSRDVAPADAAIAVD